MAVPFASSFFYFLIFNETKSIQVLYALTKLFIIVWPIFAAYCIIKSGIPLSKLLSIKKKSFFAGIAYGLTIAALITGLMQTAFGEIVLQYSNKITHKTEIFGFAGYYWVFAIFLSMIHSFMEEFYWRWFVFGNLAKIMGLVQAQLSSSAAFSLHHFIISIYFFGAWLGSIFGAIVFLGGIVWCRLFRKDGSLISVWVSHLLIDIGIMSVGHKIIFGTFI
ncbi:CPBP family intramembrane metalloprotease [Candidatus Woesearchaeota archaeon]|nr:CPBP family intramembrane metalloprotease [Candidatus Woesearchaeota archaeon]